MERRGAPQGGLISGRRRSSSLVAESSSYINAGQAVFELFSLCSLHRCFAETAFRAILDLHVLSRVRNFIFLSRGTGF